MRIVIINGSGGVGKDTFVNMCKKYNTHIQNVSSIDIVKEVARGMNWQDDKTEKGRKFLSDLKNLWDNYNQGATNRTIQRVIRIMDLTRIADTVNTTIFLHCRETEKIAFLKEKLSAECPVITLLITNENVEPITSNNSDADVFNYNYDVVISNDGTLDELQQKAGDFYNKWLCETC